MGFFFFLHLKTFILLRHLHSRKRSEEPFQLHSAQAQFWSVYFSLTSVSWNLGSEPTLVRRTGALGLWYGVVLWGLRHHGVRIGDCRGRRRKKQSVSQLLARRRAPNYNDSARIMFYYLLIRLSGRGKVIFACVAGVCRMKREEEEEEGRVRGNTAGIPVLS